MTPSDQEIDLPATPLLASSIEGPLAGEEVSAYRLDGGVLRGRLVQLSNAQCTVTIRDATQHRATEIPFSALRYLEFARALPVTPGPHPVEQRGTEVSMPKPVQEFTVTFNDGSRLSGVTRSSFVDGSSLHLFRVIDTSRITRLFIPLVAVQEYRIGPSMGDALIEDAGLRKEDIEAAVRQQQQNRSKPIGEYLKNGTALNAEQLMAALDKQAAYTGTAPGVHVSRKIGRILVEERLITEQQLNDALERQKIDRGKKLGEILEEMGAVNAQAVYFTLANKLGIPFVRLRGFDIDHAMLSLLPLDIVRKYSLIPLFMYRDRLVVAMNDPTSHEAIDVVRFITGRNLELVIATREDVQWAIANHYGIEEDAATAEEVTLSGGTDNEKDQLVRESERLSKEKPIVRLVNGIIMDAIARRASDVHLRPLEDRTDLLFRIDGTLIPVRSFTPALLPAIVARIKVIGRMNIAERRLPQDGRSRATHQGAVVDLRISVVPTVNGESVVIRLLNTQSGLKTIAQLGLSERDQALFTDLLHKSYGMILVTGPTGSGKTTTLYAALQEVIKQNVNIITVEDPVEYHVQGIEQIQVNVAAGYSFATALRHILRHDPDVIMIGEIRDQETAKIAVESALTGHLVLSTLHTNNAAGAVTRLMEMGVEPYLLSATLLAAVAQRLVRRNCPHCTRVDEVDPTIRKMLGAAEDEVFFKGAGCDECNNTGYSGRMAVYELLLLTRALRERAAIAGVTTEELHQLAAQEGMVPLTQNALAAAREGQTSLAEAYRVRLE